MKHKFSERIRQLRKEQKMTLQELSHKSGVSAVSLCHYEKGDYLPKVVVIYKIATALNADFDELLNLAKSEEKE